MKITTRAALGWGATKAKEAHPTKGVVVHYDGSNQGLAAKPHSACLAYWKRTRAFHTGPGRGWLDIGYSYGCCPHGVVLEGRGIDREQAAQPGGNRDWYSITFMSGDAEDPTPEQLDAFAQLRRWLMTKHGVGAEIKGHRDFIDTDCPGPRLYALVRSGALKTDKGEDDDVSAEDIWEHEIPVPWGTKDNPEWRARSLLVEATKGVRSIEALVRAQGAAIGQLAEALAAHHTEIDADALVARIQQAIEQVTVRLDVTP
ncbi:peptidoglycan recognition protein family protein [Nonomuraea sp. NPDC004354]